MYQFPPVSKRPDVKMRVQTVMYAIIVGCLVVAIIVFAYQFLGPGRAARQHTLQVLQDELALLPPYPGSQVVQSHSRLDVLTVLA
jgi:hypothetical protein